MRKSESVIHDFTCLSWHRKKRQFSPPTQTSNECVFVAADRSFLRRKAAPRWNLLLCSAVCAAVFYYPRTRSREAICNKYSFKKKKKITELWQHRRVEEEDYNR
jgi:hypothetical protein